MVGRGDLRETEAMEMIAAQMPAELKRARADFVVENNGALSVLEARVNEVWSALLEEAFEVRPVREDDRARGCGAIRRPVHLP